MAKDPKSILLDVQKELGGSYLEDTFQVGEHSYRMRLLDDGEFTWVFSKLDANVVGNKAALAIQIRKPSLAMGIRAINGVSIIDMFDDEWNSLDDDAKEFWINSKMYEAEARKYFSAELLLDFLSKLPSTAINDLFEKWRSLEDRQKTVKEEVKNSLGEGSEKVESERTTEPSQGGETRHIKVD